MSLKCSAVSGVRWSSASQFGRQAMQLVTTAVLARLLKPSDFGLIGMATIVIGFISLFKDLGTSAAVIHKQEIRSDFLSTIYWVNAAFGLIATIVLLILSSFVAKFYNEPIVKPLLQLLSVTFFISGLSILHQAILEREMAFNKLAKLEIIATLIGSLVGIGSAVLNCGVWSLVFQSIAVTLSTTILLWLNSRWRPAAVFRWREITTVSGYSINLMGFCIFNYFVRNADYLLIGKFLGAQDLGYYTLAYRIMLYPLQSITYVVNRVMFPALSQIQNDNTRFRKVYLIMAGTIAVITFPMMLGLIALVEPFVLVMFGKSWQPVIALLLILAPVGMVQSIGATVGIIYQAKGRTDWMFRWGLLTGIVVVSAFALGLQWGITGVAVAYLIVSAVLVYPNFAIPFKLISLSVREMIDHLYRPFLCGLTMFFIIYALRLSMATMVKDSISLVILIPTGIIIYLLSCMLVNREQTLQIMNAVRKRT